MLRLTLLLAALALTTQALAQSADKPTTSAQRVASEKLPNVPGKSVTAVEVTFPPGAVSAPHHHAGSVLVYVLEGAVRSQIDDGAPTVYRAGQTFFEPPGAHHVYSASASPTERARILAVFVADDGATLTTYDAQ
jgi:quercetin dioxygenase-like cupin family protein